jgi:hypothetical protein
MILNRRVCAFLLIFIPTIFIFAETASATVTNFRVQDDKEVIHQIKLVNEDRVLIQFSVIGQSKNSLQFSIAFPNGTVIDYGQVGVFHLSFICTSEGQYLLNFTNNDLGDSKLVTLDYEIDHYMFGMPQMLFMTIIIAVICVAGVAVFIGLSRKPY